MSSPRNFGQIGLPTLPTGDVVASYPTYEAARTAVDVLVREEGLPVSSIAVVGSDLKSVERVTGRMNYARAALSGLMNGVMIGIFLSLVWFIFFPDTDILAIAGVFVMSLAFGVIWGIIGYAFSSKKREFTSIMQVTASRFDIVVPHNISAKVRDTLQRGGSWSSPVVPPSAQPTMAPMPTSQLGHAPQVDPQPSAPEAGDASAQPEQPAQPPRTYGEMQDELRRREQERQLPEADGGSQ